MEQTNEQHSNTMIQDDSLTDEQLIIVSSREPKSIVDRLNGLAETRGLSRSKLVSQMLHSALNQSESPKIHEQVERVNEATLKSLSCIQGDIKSISNELRVIQNKSTPEQGIDLGVIERSIEHSFVELQKQFLATLSDELGGARTRNYKFMAATLLGSIFVSLAAVCFLFGAFPGELRNLSTEIDTLRTINAFGK